MREVPISCWFLAFPVVAATLSHFRIVSDILLLVVNGSEALAVARRDKDATWRKLGTLCRELDWSRSRLIHELQRGLRYRTFPEDHAINWDDPAVRLALDVEASTLPRGYASVLGLANPGRSRRPSGSRCCRRTRRLTRRTHRRPPKCRPGRSPRPMCEKPCWRLWKNTHRAARRWTRKACVAKWRGGSARNSHAIVFWRLEMT